MASDEGSNWGVAGVLLSAVALALGAGVACSSSDFKRCGAAKNCDPGDDDGAAGAAGEPGADLSAGGSGVEGSTGGSGTGGAVALGSGGGPWS
jgi:hypothetical protein